MDLWSRSGCRVCEFLHRLAIGTVTLDVFGWSHAHISGPLVWPLEDQIVISEGRGSTPR